MHKTYMPSRALLELTTVAAIGLLALGCGEDDSGPESPIVDAAVRRDARVIPDAQVGSCPGNAPGQCCAADCPGIGTSGAVSTCEENACVFRCEGENYDVDGMTETGCEAADTPLGNHTQKTATDLGSLPCGDGSSNPNISAVMLSDKREHVPAIGGFDSESGTAPDVYRIFGDGGVCVNDISLTLEVSGSSMPQCYQLTFNNAGGDYSCRTDKAGSCTISEGSGSYNDDTEIHLVVEKVCDANTLTESISYTVTGHL